MMDLLNVTLSMARRICAWCNKDMGPAPGDLDTHGICPDCAKKVE